MNKHLTREFRARYNLTQLELAERLGVTRRTVAGWETAGRVRDHPILERALADLARELEEEALCAN